jgi:ABC-type glycerol-3-phosphate transport system permease component
MIERGFFDSLTDEECERAGIDNALDWQYYCKFVEPDCTHHFFLWGYDE